MTPNRQGTSGGSMVLGRPIDAEVLNVINSPGPWENMRFDIVVRYEHGDQTYSGVKPVNDGPTEYDVIGAKPGSPVGITFRGSKTIMFVVPFLPVTFDCTQQPPP